MRAVLRDLFQGIGKPEPLKVLGPGVWSHRITQEHRCGALVRALKKRAGAHGRSQEAELRAILTAVLLNPSRRNLADLLADLLAAMQAFWADAVRNDTPLFLAAITIGELRRGVELIRHRGDRPQALLLDLDGDAAQLWGRLRVPDSHNAIDKQIAAIALLHDLTVVTRNSADFAGCGVRLLNPFPAP